MKSIFARLLSHQNITAQESKELLHQIAQGKCSDSQIGALITIFQMRSISTTELIGFREALLELALPVDLSQYSAIDIVGTGGDGKDTFNISTAASFVVAAAGYNVVKHGNYGATSTSGSSNVLEHFGVKFTNQSDKLKRSLDVTKMAYLHAPLFNPALKAVAKARREVGVRSFFNTLGPLVNPSSPQYSLLGVYDLAMARLYSYTYQNMGARYAIVHSLDGYDEISLTSNFKIIGEASEQIFSPEQIGFDRISPSQIYSGGTIEQAASIFIDVLQGNATQAREDVVVATAAFGIRLIEPQMSIECAIAKARQAIESGAAYQNFCEFIKLNS